MRINIFLTTFTLLSVVSATDVSGIVSSNTTWTFANSPYVVTGNILVNEGVTLTIEPGVIVKVDSGKGLSINGSLIANGTNTANIVFTSNQTNPSNGEWESITFYDTSVDANFDVDGSYLSGSVIQYAVLEYAGSSPSGSGYDSNGKGAITVNDSYPLVKNCIIKNNGSQGLHYNITGSTSHDLRIENNLIYLNNTSGIGIYNPYSGTNIYILENKILQNGTGISIFGNDAIINKNVIMNNLNDGINTFFWGGTGLSCTISNNNISGNGSYGFYGVTSQATFTITNNIFIGNGSHTIYSRRHVTHTTGGQLIVNNNNILENSTYKIYNGSNLGTSFKTFMNP